VKIFAKSLTRILLELQSKGVVFSGESEKLSKFIGDKIGTEVASYPIFSIYDPSPAVPGFLSAEREIDVLYCPSSVSELSICINSFNELLKNGTALRGRLIWRSGRSRKLFKEELDELSRLDIQVQSETLSRAEYIEIHENSKICVLPYLHDFYLWGSSGRVNDSILFNAVPIVPKNTALAERVGPNSPLVYDREDPISLATSVQKVLDYEPSRLELCPITMEDFKNWALNVTEDRRVQSHQEFSKSTLIATLLLLPALLSQIDFKERLLSALTHKIYQLKNGETIIKFFRKWLPGRV
jgi:hypothetical protein